MTWLLYKLRSDYDRLLLNPLKIKTLTALGDPSFARCCYCPYEIHCPLRLEVASFTVADPGGGAGGPGGRPLIF